MNLNDTQRRLQTGLWIDTIDDALKKPVELGCSLTGHDYVLIRTQKNGVQVYRCTYCDKEVQV